MKIQYLVSMAGPSVQIVPGDVRIVDTAEALSLIEAGYAVAVYEPVIEVSEPQPVQVATINIKRRKRA